MSIPGTVVPLSASLALVMVGGCSTVGESEKDALGQLVDTKLADLGGIQSLHEPQAEHCIQEEMNEIADPGERFIFAFDCGDELFEVVFNSLDGVGANVGGGQRFTRVPRADRLGDGEWATHVPERATGPNGQACNQCHNLPFDDGAGNISGNVIRDPLHSGQLSQFIQRNTPHVFAPGALQVLAEEMTASLQGTREFFRDISCQLGGFPIPVQLRTKGVSFGNITVRCNGNDNTAGVRGVAADLAVRPFQWKGNNTSLRDFNRGAAHNELGIQPVEITGDDIDGDGDGVTNEAGIGDMSALAVYLAAQPRPVTKVELAALGIIELPAEEAAAIDRGEEVFEDVGCENCHRSRLTINDPIFAEPSINPAFRDAAFPAGQDPIERGVDPANPIAFDLTADQPDNVIEVNGEEVHLGSFEANDDGGAIVRLFGDLRRHDMGAELAEAIDEIGTGASVFLTENLWGVGSTAPYLHDGRASTLTEAILAHGGEATSSRNAFASRSEADQDDLIAFLDNLVLFKAPEEEAAPEE
jgi:Di-haem oxidoreductase, putative peroxidase